MIWRLLGVLMVLSTGTYCTGSTFAGEASDKRQSASDTATPDQQRVSCSAVLGQDRDAVWAYNNRGNAWNKGDADSAIAEFDKAIRLDPDFAKAYNGRGLAYTSRGDLDHAIADFEEAIRLDPEFVLPYYYPGASGVFGSPHSIARPLKGSRHLFSGLDAFALGSRSRVIMGVFPCWTCHDDRRCQTSEALEARPSFKGAVSHSRAQLRPRRQTFGMAFAGSSWPHPKNLSDLVLGRPGSSSMS